MKKILLTALLAILVVSGVALANFFPDIIVTNPNGIWLDTRAYSTINAAITAVGANTRDVYIVRRQPTTSLTVPSNISLKFVSRGSIANSGQLTINTKNIEASNRQIFSGVGNIDFADGTILKTGWFSNTESAFALTTNDVVTLIVSNPQNITASYSPGNDVTLKWESPGNILTVNAGITVGNLKKVEAGNYQIWAGAGDLDFLDGAVLNLSWFNRLRTVVTWAGTDEVTVVSTEPSNVTFDNTIPASMTLKVNRGATLTISAGRAITVNGSFEAGLYQAFSHNNTDGVIFGATSIKETHPIWWNGDAGDGATDVITAIQSAIDSLPSGGTVFFAMGEYRSSGNLGMTYHNLKLKGAGSGYNYDGTSNRVSIIRFIGGTVGIDFIDTVAGPNDARNCTIEDLVVAGNSVLTNGIRLARRNLLKRVTVMGCTGIGIYMTDPTIGSHLVECNSFGNGTGVRVDGAATTTYSIERCNIRQNTGIGLELLNGRLITVKDTVLESNGTYGLRIYKPSGEALNSILLENVWLESNNNAANGYQILIDSVDRDYAGGPPARIEFKYCMINAGGLQKHLNIESAKWVELKHVQFFGGDLANGINLGAFASYVEFTERNGPAGWTFTGGNRCTDVAAKTTGSAGITTTGDIHKAGGRTETFWFSTTTIAANTDNQEVYPPHYNNAGAGVVQCPDYTMLSSGSIVGLVVHKDQALTAGTLEFKIGRRVADVGFGAAITDLIPAAGHVSMDSTDSKTMVFTYVVEELTFLAEQSITVRLKTDAAYAGGSNQKIVVGVVVEF